MTSHRPAFSARVLAELLCQREEAAGHPYESPEADARARVAGGSFADRILTRAQSLPEASSLEAAVRSVQRIAWFLLGLIACIAFVAGCVTASSILTGTSVDLPLALLALIGLNFATFLLWLIIQPFAQRLIGLAGGLNRLFRWILEHRFSKGIFAFFSDRCAQLHQRSNTIDALNAIVAQGRGRWLFSTAIHSIWLAFATGSLLALAILLSLRHYLLAWETTLLNASSLEAVEHAFSIGPMLLGIAGPAKFSVTDTATAAAGQYWSSWLLRAALVYGVLPRLVALLVCVALFWRAARRIGCDTSRPGFARLRSRLMPDSAVLQISDRDTAIAPSRLPDRLIAVVLKGRVYGIALDSTDSAPHLVGVEWTWLDQDSDAAAHTGALQRLHNEQVKQLAIVVRAAMTPDRGVERRVDELRSAARAETVLLLGGLDQLHERGQQAYRNRISQWRDLANRAGATAVLSTNGELIAPDSGGAQW